MPSVSMQAARRAASFSLCAFILTACGGGGSSGNVVIPPAAGKRVIYTTDTDGTGFLGVGNDEVWLADLSQPLSRGVRISKDVPAGDQTAYPFAIPNGGPFGYLVAASTGPSCRQEVRLVPHAGGTTRTLFDEGCVLQPLATPNGARVLMWTWNTANNDQQLWLADHELSTLQRLDSAATGGSVGEFALDATGTVAYWVDNSGIHSASVQGALGSVTGQLVVNQATTMMLPTSGGNAVVYNTGAEDALRVVSRDGTGDTALIANAAPDFVFQAELSADDAFVLYERSNLNITDQLWLVPLANPLAEQRVDTTYPLTVNRTSDWAISPDGARFAWIGNDGGGQRVFVASAAAPGTATAMTPVFNSISDVHWTDAATLVFAAGNTGQALQSVSINAPMTLVRLGPDETSRSSFSIVPCGDGTILWLSSVSNGSGNDVVMWRGTPLDASSVVQALPTMQNLGAGLMQFACVD